MTFEARLRQHLVNEGLSIGQRIYPQIVPVDPVYPLVVINQPTAPFVNHRDGGRLHRITKTFRTYAETQREAWRVAIELRSAITRFRGFIYNEADGYETESKRYMVVTIAQFWSRD